MFHVINGYERVLCVVFYVCYVYVGCESMCATLHLVSLILVVKQHRSFVSSGLAALRSTHRIVYVPCVPNEKEKQKKIHKLRQLNRTHFKHISQNSNGEIQICNFRSLVAVFALFSFLFFFSSRLVSKCYWFFPLQAKVSMKLLIKISIGFALEIHRMHTFRCQQKKRAEREGVNALHTTGNFFANGSV